MNFINKNQSLTKLFAEKTFNIWSKLIGLTLLSAYVAESDNQSLAATILVCCIALLKGHWVIDHFMGLRHAAPLTRGLVKFYFYLMTCLVGLTAIYSQSLIQVM